MSRTDISAASLADYLRRKAGDGGIEWCYEPMQTSVLLDMADMLDENAKLREQGARLFDKTLELKTDNDKLRGLVRDLWEACPADGYYCIYHCEHYDKESESHCKLEDRMAELGIEVDQ